jgi:hypothetical protein
MPSQKFTTGQQVWLEGTNIKTTHPKAKLTPQHHRPFKILNTTPTNSQLQLPQHWHIYPIFHNSLLIPYTITPKHGPNYTQPPPIIVDSEDKHYEVETVLNVRTTPNQCDMQYLVKWKGYPNSENFWVSTTGMKHIMALVEDFHHQHLCFQTTSHRCR